MKGKRKEPKETKDVTVENKDAIVVETDIVSNGTTIAKNPSREEAIAYLIEKGLDVEIYKKMGFFPFDESEKLKKTKIHLSVDIEIFLGSYCPNEKEINSPDYEPSYVVNNKVDIKILRKSVEDKTLDKKMVVETKQFKKNAEFYKKTETFNQLNAYLEKHLIFEIERIIYRLDIESLALGERGKQREEQIRRHLETEETWLRNRIATFKGRIPNSQQNDNESEKTDFLAQCFRALQEIEKKKRKLNRTELVKINFDRDTNPHQALRRKLKSLGLTFEEVLQLYSEQKSS